jgi:hypothetical protein
MPAFYREHECFALRRQRLGKRCERSIRSTVWAAPEEADIVMARIERADSKFCAIEILRRARRRSVCRAEAEGEKRA